MKWRAKDIFAAQTIFPHRNPAAPFSSAEFYTLSVSLSANIGPDSNLHKEILQ
jgi:hypothetical protein